MALPAVGTVQLSQAGSLNRVVQPCFVDARGRASVKVDTQEGLRGTHMMSELRYQDFKPSCRKQPSSTWSAASRHGSLKAMTRLYR